VASLVSAVSTFSLILATNPAFSAEGGVLALEPGFCDVSALSLHVGQLFADGPVPHLEYINSSDESLFSCSIDPLVFPTHNAPKTDAKNLLDFDMGMGRLAEEVLPKPGNCFLPRVDSAVRGWLSVFEDTIVTHQLHHPCDILTVEGFIELKDDSDR
jgi:hypothetical protein